MDISESRKIDDYPKVRIYVRKAKMTIHKALPAIPLAHF
jgi:hypothetical protein